ncbi:hypothetical protein DEO72_LG9g1955 [Vigna unguiculata]|uniref:Uncharacterized protein n=1 Tax=Vigna unguiculata TaxID=3917 RepID=A0A4D6N260_VIGUN|nr:hypothetical protein DEO72_LG9g1955 [Vigna unguiculata]
MQEVINIHLDIIIVNNFSSCSSTLIEQQITSQSATSTLTYHSHFDREIMDKIITILVEVGDQRL